MEIDQINNRLSLGQYDHPGLFPHLDSLKKAPYQFTVDFGLKTLPIEPGVLLIRGARQYGKSTWLEQQLYSTVREFGPGSAYYLNGEYITDKENLENELEQLLAIFPPQQKIRRIFIDEITAIPSWEIILKRVADRGKLKNVLIITTGSSATDLRRGSEKLPGRKGKLAKTTYLFTPISYKEFHRVCHSVLQEKTLFTYLLSGGSPIACAEMASNHVIPEYVIELVRDWVEGEISKMGRNRTSLYNIFNALFRFGVSPIGQAKLAREAGLANNTVAAGYTEILNDLGCLIPTYVWDQHRQILILRKPCKYHFTNLLVAVAYHSARLRRVEDFLQLAPTSQGIWLEWLIAQELQRRAAVNGQEFLAPLRFWQNQNHEIDFVESSEHYIEVKNGQSSPREFSWFAKQFPGKQLTVINSTVFSAGNIRGVTLEDFLLL